MIDWGVIYNGFMLTGAALLIGAACMMAAREWENRRD